MAAYRMFSAGHHGKAQLFVVLGSLLQVIDDDNDVIDSLKHEMQH